MEKSNYTINNVYQGGYSSLSPSYGDVFTGYRTDAGDIGMSTDARTANVLQEVSSKLTMGVKTIELSQVMKDVFESIPLGQLKEVNRQAKLTGAEVTLHAPVIEPSGISQQGFDEVQRKAVERQMDYAIERAHELNPDGSSPVTFHSSVEIPASKWKMTDEGKKIEKFIVINQETGKMAPIGEETKFYPGHDLKKGEILSPERELNVLNNSEWINNLTSIESFKKQADEVMSGALIPLTPLIIKQNQGKPVEITTPKQKAALEQIQKANIFLENVESGFNAAFNKAYQYSDERSKEKLKKISDHWVKEHEKLVEKIKKSGGRINPIQEVAIISEKSKLINDSIHGNQELGIEGIRNIASPEVYVPIEKFAVDKSSETFASVAFDSFKKFKDKAPIISIENPPIGTALDTGEELKNLVEASRKKFVEKAVEQGYSESTAKNQADKLIGVTWDVGHINMLRKQGFESKDIVKETEYIAPFIKHVHLSDNFGLEHTELPMGMGNVPLKEIMKKVDKEGFKGKKIVEAVNWWQHFKTPPFTQTLEALGSPIYSDSVGPYWNQAMGFQQGYSVGYGQMLPQINYETFGAGFVQLPAELGGQRPGAGGRMSGQGME